jgi:xanthine dehydrogenase accessory factor
MRVWSRLLDAIRRHQRAAMVTIVGAFGSTPREAGARLIVHPDGGFTGTIGGGTLEWRAIALAQAALADSSPQPFELRSFALGPELGQCCGGRVELAVEVFDATRLQEVEALTARESEGGFTTEARSEGGRLVRRVMEDRTLPGGYAAWSDGKLTEGFGELARPLFLFGAGHVGRALALALAPLPFAVTWVDPRPDAFPAYVPANVIPRRFENAVDAIVEAPQGAFILVMTHSHGLDLAIVHAAFVAERFPYIGLIGSATKRARFEKRLAEGGISRERIATLVCPIGVAGIKSKAPAAIAAATAAELLIRDEALRAATGTIPEEAGSKKRGRGGAR